MEQNATRPDSAPVTHAPSGFAWIREGLRASTLRAVQALPEGPGAWPMLLIFAAAAAILIGASRFEVPGPASFDVRTWLFSWAPTGLLICAVWLVLTATREKTTHASPVAAWFLLYSVATIPPLESENTLVMTAADKEHTSFGCGSRSPLTYFGRAVFDEQLRKTRSFEDAFNAAVPVIKQREIEAKKDDGFSNPQISVGANIRAVLEQLVEQLDRQAEDATEPT